MILAIALAVLAGAACVTATWALLARRQLGHELDAARQFVELANDPILVADIVQGRILHANPAAVDMLAYTRDELLGLTLPDLHPKALMKKSAELIADVWEKKGLIYSSLPFVTKEDEYISVEVSARVFRFGDQPAILIFARDIRERKRLESQLVQSEKMAALGQLVAGVAHEINTPIGSIHANADVSRTALAIVKKALFDSGLADDDKGNRRLKRAIVILDETCDTNKIASDRIVQIVRSLRNFARLDEADRKRVDIHEGLESTLTLLRHELKRGVKVEKQYGTLPEVDCFPNQLNQVFMNIMMNAIQAMDGSGTLTITTERDDGDVLVRFTDTGKGIPKDKIDRVFDPGFTTKGVGVGTGLGLSISYQIVQKHEGEIEVVSEVGKGATFTVRLPIKRETRAAATS